MGAPILWSGNAGKLLKKILNFNDQTHIEAGDADPSSVATAGEPGYVYISSNGGLYVKQDSGTTTNWIDLTAAPAPGTFAALTDITDSFPPSNVKITSDDFMFQTDGPFVVNSTSGDTSGNFQLLNSAIELFVENTTTELNSIHVQSPGYLAWAAYDDLNSTSASVEIRTDLAAPFVNTQGGFVYVSKTYSASVSELVYGFTAHDFEFVPVGTVKINKDLCGSFFYIYNNSGGNITFGQNTSETFNGSTTYILPDDKIATFYQISDTSSGSGVFTVSLTSSDVTLAAIGSTPNANGATLTGQVLNLQPADASFGGVLTSGTQSIAGAKTFTGAITASNLSGTNTGNQTITLTGGVTGSGTGSFVATVITNANLTGDITSIGNATTLATVATGATTGSSTAIPVVTFNNKGLVTAITTAAVIAPAGTLSGNTLNSGITTSSLTSFGNSPTLVTPNLGTPTTLVGTNITGTASGLTAGNALVTETIKCVLNGQGIAIAAGTYHTETIPFSGTITSAVISSDLSGSIVFDIKKCTYANFPGSLTSITASSKPTLSSAQKSQNALTSWTTTVTAGDIIQWVVDSATTVQRVTLTLGIIRT